MRWCSGISPLMSNKHDFKCMPLQTACLHQDLQAEACHSFFAAVLVCAVIA